jgi:membrane protein
MDVFEMLIGAQPRSWRRQRLMALGWVAATLVITVGATWALLEANGALDAVRAAAPSPVFWGRMRRGFAEGMVHVDVIVVLITLCTIALAVFYRYSVVHPPTVRRRVWPGTLVAISLWVLVSCAFGAWVSKIAQYTVYYGSLATVAVILLWLYLTSLALLVGAEVNARLEGVGNRTMIPL